MSSNKLNILGNKIYVYSETCLERPLPWQTTCLEGPHIPGRSSHMSMYLNLAVKKKLPVLRGHIFAANRVVFHDRFYCIICDAHTPLKHNVCASWQQLAQVFSGYFCYEFSVVKLGDCWKIVPLVQLILHLFDTGILCEMIGQWHEGWSHPNQFTVSVQVYWYHDCVCICLLIIHIA